MEGVQSSSGTFASYRHSGLRGVHAEKARQLFFCLLSSNVRLKSSMDGWKSCPGGLFSQAMLTLC